MRVVGALGVALARLSVIGAVTAYAQIDTRSQYGGTTVAVVDDKGNPRVPADYRTVYQMLGSWAVAKDNDPRLDLHARLSGSKPISGAWRR